MTENEFENAVIDTARHLGYRAHAQRPGRYGDGRVANQVKGDTGWPDVCLVGWGHMFLLELKRDRKSKVQPGQREWCNAANAVPGVTSGFVFADQLDELRHVLIESRSLGMKAGHQAGL